MLIETGANQANIFDTNRYRHAELLKDFAYQLELATDTALGLAVRTVVDSEKASGRNVDDTILPVVVGGDGAMATVSALSSSMAHDLREGLAMGREDIEFRLCRAAQSRDLRDDVRQGIGDLYPVATGTGDGQVVHLLDAMLLEAISRPSPRDADTEGGRSGANATTSAGVRS